MTPILLREVEETPVVREEAPVPADAAAAVAKESAALIESATATLGPAGVLMLLNEAELTTKKRDDLPKTAFAIPEKRAYPIHDLAHARNALARVAQHGDPAEQKRVRAAVRKRYPALKEHEAEVQGRLEEALLNASVLLAVHGPVAEAGEHPHDNPPQPFSTSTTSNWVARAGGLPSYIQHVAHSLVAKHGESKAIEMAVGIVRNWSEGKGHVHPAIKAAAAKAMAEWEAKRAAAHARSAAGTAAHAVSESAAPSWMLPPAARQPGFRPLNPPKKTSSSSSSSRSVVGGNWSESKHPRGYGGKFVTAGSSGAAARGAKKRLGGELSKSRIEAFQKNHGLQVDGVIGKQTVAAMMGNKNASKVATGALTSKDVKYLTHHAG